MLSAIPIPSLLITGTDTGIGKTIIAASLAQILHEQNLRVAVLKPAGSGCVHRREGLVSEDAELLAHCANARHPLDLICPQRYAEPLAPAIAAERAKQPLDWEAINRSIKIMSADSDVMIIEGIGGLLVPMDEKHTFLDAAADMKSPAVIVARPALGTINHTLLTLQALRSRNIPIAGVVINRYPTDTPNLAEETNPRAIEKWGKVPILAIVPDTPIPKTISPHPIPAAILDSLRLVDWPRLAGLRAAD
jgi:dethiobiotin synthetase